MPVLLRLRDILMRRAAAGFGLATVFAAWRRYAAALLVTALAAAVAVALRPFPTSPISVVFLAAVAVSAAHWGRGPALLAILLSVASLHVLFTAPGGSLMVRGIGDAIHLLAFLLVALLVGGFCERLWRARGAADARAERLTDPGRRLASQVQETGVYAREPESHRAELESRCRELEALLERERELNEELRVSNRRLYEEARRGVMARDDLLGAVTHELKNSLVVVTWTARRLDRSGLGDDERGRLIGRIGSAVERARRLIGELTTASQLEAGRLELDVSEEDPAELAGGAIDRLAGIAADEGLTLRLGVEDGVPAARLDSARVTEVLHNLIANAIEHTPEGGRIDVRVERRDDTVMFSVADTGEGIAAGDLPHIFDQLGRAEPTDPAGAGLGLAICRGIVEAHGGRIRAESEPGSGSTFSFTIPLHPARPAGEFVLPPRGAR